MYLQSLEHPRQQPFHTLCLDDFLLDDLYSAGDELRKAIADAGDGSTDMAPGEKDRMIIEHAAREVHHALARCGEMPSMSQKARYMLSQLLQQFVAISWRTFSNTSDEARWLELLAEFELAVDPLNRESCTPLPDWNNATRELWLGERLVKRFTKNKAPMQVQVYDAFQRAGWPTDRGIQSPFARTAEVVCDYEHKILIDTIHSMNKSLALKVMTFNVIASTETCCWRRREESCLTAN